ncbi:hypothetical protein XMA127_000982 [Marinobacterium sp. xm-a-127]|nr:hypothetical protein [Marinobacterium sp. xm-d-510]NRP97239.1 hypothetical protein [Marinobacterium sp. xm-a-127]
MIFLLEPYRRCGDLFGDRPSACHPLVGFTTFLEDVERVDVRLKPDTGATSKVIISTNRGLFKTAPTVPNSNLVPICPRPIESEYDGFSRLRVQSAEARMAEVCNGGRSRLCSVLLDFSEKSLNGACRRPSERGQFLGTFC